MLGWRLAVLLCCLMAIGTTGILYYSQLDPLTEPSPAELSEVEARKHRDVVALGRLEPASRIISVGAPAGSRIVRSTAREGAHVNEGDVLAWLESHDEMKAARDYAAAQLAESQQQLQIETAAGALAIKLAELELKSAQELLPLKILAQEADVRETEAAYEQSRRDRDRIKALADRNAVTPNELEYALLGCERFKEQLAEKQAVLKQLTLDRDIQVQLAELRVETARAEKSRHELDAHVESLTRQLALAEARLEQTLIRAPIKGEILEVTTRAGESVGGAPVLRMADTSLMHAVAEVYETDVARIQIGQRATVHSTAFDEDLTGVVVEIAAFVQNNKVLGVDPTADVDARIVEVRVALDDSRIASRFSQHEVDVRIHVEQPGPGTP